MGFGSGLIRLHILHHSNEGNQQHQPEFDVQALLPIVSWITFQYSFTFFFWHFCLYRLSPTMIVIQLFNRYLYHIIVDTYIYIYVISPNYHIYIHFSTVIMPCSASFFSSALRRRHVGAAGSISAAVAVASPMHCLGVAKKAQRLGGFFWCVPVGQRWISDENLGWEWWLPSGKLTVGPWK